MNTIIEVVLYFTLLYPIIMSFVWVVGSVLYEVRKRRNRNKFEEPTHFEEFTIVVPVYNEEDHIKDTLQRNLRSVHKSYPNTKFLIINDHSTDNTKKLLEEFINSAGVEIVNLEKNLGKAGVLNYALDVIDTEYFICIDSDTYIYPEALNVLNKEIFNEKDESVAAYTGSLSINQREGKSSLLKIQKLEYRSIIGVIKRTQDYVFKNLMTVSGALTCYKTEAIKAVGGFSTTNATEDIEITWALTSKGYRSRFLDEFCAEIFSPEDGHGLLKQRIRWNLGSIETSRDYKNLFFKKGTRRVRFFMIDRIFSLLWIYAFVITTTIILLSLFFGFPKSIGIVDVILPTVILILTSLILQTVAYVIDKNKREPFDVFLTLILYYPLAYWFVNPSGYFGGLWTYVFTKPNHGHWRIRKKYSIKFRSLMATIIDLGLYFFLISLWNIVLGSSLAYLPLSMVTIYYLILVFWMGLAVIYYLYFITIKRSTFAENILGLKSKRDRTIIQTVLSPVAILVMANSILNSSTTIEILSISELDEALLFVSENVAQGGIINEKLYVFYILVFIDQYFGLSKKLFKNPLVRA